MRAYLLVKYIYKFIRVLIPSFSRIYLRISLDLIFSLCKDRKTRSSYAKEGITTDPSHLNAGEIVNDVAGKHVISRSVGSIYVGQSLATSLAFT